MTKTISIVTPCYNEEQSVQECVDTLRDLFDKELPGYRRGHIFCDNASTYRTVEILRRVAQEKKSVKVIVNSRNFGSLKNTYNGVLNASGDAAVLFMPVDLQDPPELIPQFVKLWEQGCEIIYGMRAQREEGVVIESARKAYYRLLSRLTYVDYPADAGDFQLVDRCVLDAMKRIDDAQPFMRMMTFDVGFKSVRIKYTWRARKHGKSRDRLSRIFDQGLNGIISFSGVPVRIALLFGVGLSVVSLFYAFFVTYLAVFGKLRTFPGIPTLIAAVFFFGVVQIFFLGVLVEYIMSIHNQVRRKPIVVERERINFGDALPVPELEARR